MLKTARRIGAASAVALVASLWALAQTSTWNIDPAHSTAQFTVRHLGISNITGSFTKVTGTVVLNDRDITQSEVSATIDVYSVDTRVEARDKDLKSPHFFEVEKYPTIEFKSKKIVSNGGRLQVIGDLTIHATTTINRKISICFTTTFSRPVKRWLEIPSRSRSTRKW